MNTPYTSEKEDPRAVAARLRLSYVTLDTKGFRRMRFGKNTWQYKNAVGSQVTDKKDLERIALLVIPPAWKDVWIAKSARAHIQATGIDAKGDKQYRYHAAWSAARASDKFDRLIEFATHLPTLRRAIKKGLTQKELTREKAIAIALRLTDELALRIGNEAYAKENNTYGVTTLRNKHVDISKNKIELHFVGKSHQEQSFELTDTPLAKALTQELALPGESIMQYEDSNFHRHTLTSREVNMFLQNITGARITAKDFRTWVGTAEAYKCMKTFCKKNEIADAKEYEKELRRVIKEVAEKLGNTIAVCKTHYVHACLQEMFVDGSFQKHLVKPIKGSAKKRTNGLKGYEAELFDLLTSL